MKKDYTKAFTKAEGGYRIEDYETFNTLYGDATVADEETFVSDYSASPVVLGDDYTGDDMVEAAAMLSALWQDANRSVSEIRAATGQTQKQFALRFCIPAQTVAGWEIDRRSPPPYLILALSDLVGVSIVKRGPAHE